MGFVRIIAGEFKGRRLKTPGGDSVRPTADRVREAWFSILQRSIRGARVLDLFAGSGALGLESLSRGATTAEFVELHTGSYANAKGTKRARELARLVDARRRADGEKCAARPVGLGRLGLDNRVFGPRFARHKDAEAEPRDAQDAVSDRQ